MYNSYFREDFKVDRKVKIYIVIRSDECKMWNSLKYEDSNKKDIYLMVGGYVKEMFLKLFIVKCFFFYYLLYIIKDFYFFYFGFFELYILWWLCFL